MLSVSAPQHVFLEGLNTKYRAFVGGFGSGKTFVGCLDLATFAGKYPGVKQGYFGPTYPAIRDIFYPTFDEAAHMLGFRTRARTTDKEVDLYRGRWYYGTIICRSMDKPSSIVGFKVARALVDEIDILPIVKAQEAWNKIVGRLRLKIDGVVNGVGVTTTPEGFRFVYTMFKDDPTQSYSMVQASTYENVKHLPDDYISSLLETYDSQLVLAYIGGQFVNLTTGTVYYNFNRNLNHSDVIEEAYEPIYVGMDFNVGKMAAVAHVKRNDKTIAVNEWVDKLDTPHMIQAIKDTYPDHRITVYPDASGSKRGTATRANTEEELKNDISLLEQAGFSVAVNKSNPRVKSRVSAMNAMFCNANMQRRYLVNRHRCPTYVGNLEKQAYDEAGQPDKTQGFDHTNDAAGYYLNYDYPVDKPLIIPKVKMYG